MKEMILPKGSVVKFGCLSTSLYSHLRNGMPTKVINDVVSMIHVGELIAYQSACSQFCHQTMQVHEEHDAVLTEFVQSLQTQVGKKPELPDLEQISIKAGLPVIIEIELQEDCVIMNDAQFDVGVEKSWKIWRSVYLKRNEGIPASWLKFFYFPRLLDYKDLTHSTNPKLKEQTTDCALMVGGLMQTWHKDTPGDLLYAFKKQYGRTNFSQKMEMSEASIERFFNINAMLDPASRLLNQITMWQDINALAQKQEIQIS